MIDLARRFQMGFMSMPPHFAAVEGAAVSSTSDAPISAAAIGPPPRVSDARSPVPGGQGVQLLMVLLWVRLDYGLIRV
jgi:hypothetical protein